MDIQPNGDQGIIIRFAEEVTPELNTKVQQLLLILEKASIPGVIEMVPAYNSIAIYYNPSVMLYLELRETVLKLTRELFESNVISKRIIHIPVHYGGEDGPDLERLACHAGLDLDEVIELHKEPKYLVYMLGFLPGFPYMGGLNSKLVIPRLKSPRGVVPSGSVGIAQEQTGIYPIESPGGWNIIGRTPLPIFNPQNQEDAFLFQPGDYAQFYKVSNAEYLEIEKMVQNSTFKLEIEHF
jgi:inhibitor of KinA